MPAHVIASGLLGTYLGEDAGRRVHAGSIMRGSVDTLRAVIWYADIRGFTPISDAAPGRVIVDLLNDVFEILTASLRPRGGQVLKFIGDGMLATFSFEEADRAEACRRALDAAIEAMRNIDELNNGARGGRGSGRIGRSRPPSRRSALRQCRRDRPAGLHRHRPCRQRGRANRGLVRAARARGSRLGRICRRGRRRRRPPRPPRPPRAARRQERRRRSSRWTWARRLDAIGRRQVRLRATSSSRPANLARELPKSRDTPHSRTNKIRNNRPPSA